MPGREPRLGARAYRGKTPPQIAGVHLGESVGHPLHGRLESGALEWGVGDRELLHALALECDRDLFVAPGQHARHDDPRTEGWMEHPVPGLVLLIRDDRLLRRLGRRAGSDGCRASWSPMSR